VIGRRILLQQRGCRNTDDRSVQTEMTVRS
jgi:hypothetical protein